MQPWEQAVEDARTQRRPHLTCVTPTLPRFPHKHHGSDPFMRSQLRLPDVGVALLWRRAQWRASARRAPSAICASLKSHTDAPFFQMRETGNMPASPPRCFALRRLHRAGFQRARFPRATQGTCKELQRESLRRGPAGGSGMTCRACRGHHAVAQLCFSQSIMIGIANIKGSTSDAEGITLCSRVPALTVSVWSGVPLST